jgi:hypothetical protein
MFGLGGKIKDIQWSRNLVDFHQQISVGGVVFQFIRTSKDKHESCDHILVFEEMDMSLKKRDFTCPSFEEEFVKPWNGQCECGASYDHNAPSNHYSWCPMYMTDGYK